MNPDQADREVPTTAILVLGMHRSGTSAITRVLNLLGAELPRNIMPPVPDNNEAGFWESRDIADLHDQMLAAAGSSWDDCLELPRSFCRSETAKRFADALLEILNRDFSGTSQFVVKDPRICRFVPLWIDLLKRFGAEPCVVLIFRHPHEVASSLKRRDGFDEHRSAHLWLRHVLDMEKGSRGLRRSFLAYDALLKDWSSAVEKIALDLDLRWPRSTEETAANVEGFLSETLRHHWLSDQELAVHPRLLGWVKKAYAALQAATDEDIDPAPSLDRITRSLRSAERVFGPTLSALQSELRNRHSTVEQLREEFGSEQGRFFQQQLAVLATAHQRDREAYEAEIAKVGKILEESDAKVYRQKELIEELVAERDRLQATYDRAESSYEAEIRKIRSVLKESDAKVYRLRDRLESLVAERNRLDQSRREAESGYQARIAALEMRLEQADQKVRDQHDQLQSVSAERDRLEKVYLEATRRHEADGARLRALAEEAATERRRLAQALKDADGEVERLGLRLTQARASSTRLENRVTDLETSLRSTRRDKDWLWEQWQEVLGELESLRGSKVGRPLWWLWQAYLSSRRGAIRARAALRGLLFQAERSREAPTVGRRRWAAAPRALARRGVHLVTRALGWLFLLGDVALEKLAALARRLTPARTGTTADEPTATSRAATAVIGRRPRVLLMSPYPIFPPHHGGGVRLYNLVKRIADHCELHLLVFSATGEDSEQREALSPWAESIHFHHWRPGYEAGPWHLQPPNAGLFASDVAARQVAHLLATQRIDILQLEYTELGQYGLPRFARVKIVLTEHDLAYRQHWRRRKMRFHERYPEGNAYGSSFGDWLRLTRYEIAVCRRADQIHVMSRDDGQSLSEFLDDGWRRLRVVPNAVDTLFYAPPPESDDRRGVLYVGNFQNLPNVDALEYLVEEIWPRIRSRQPQAELTVVGAHPSERVTRLHGEAGVNVVGSVPDLRPYYHEHRLMVAPIRAGSGTRLKILEAFAAGLPVVSTALGAEGIAARAGDHLLLADQPDEFAAAVVGLLEEEALCRRLSDNGKRLAVEQYDWSRSAEAALRGWEELLQRSDSEAGSGDPDPSDGESSRSPRTRTTGPSPPETPSVAQTKRERDRPEISVIIPTYRGGPELESCLQAIAGQQTDRTFEFICIDSGSDDADLATMRAYGARLMTIDPADFDHGLTRDRAASESRAEVLVFLNQDAVPSDERWLERLTEPLFEDDSCSAVQGGIREAPDPEQRFFWDSCGDRFYFTRESTRWLERYFGVGFSTVNAAIRRSVWTRYPFGRAQIMEDKKWQREIVAAGHAIYYRPEAEVTHTHNYRLRSLWRRCLSEGFGWRLVGETYSLLDLLRDASRLRVHKDLAIGLARGRIRSAAELLFPWLRPVALYWGNHWSRDVKL